jgi:hypothetical protein
MKENILIGRISDVFQLARRGVVIVPFEPWAASLKVGSVIELRKPDGSCLITRVVGLEMSNPPRLDGRVGLLIGDASLSKDDVAQGTEVYVTRQA